MSADAPSQVVSENRLARKRRQTRARLLQAAYRIFAQVGVEDAKIADIADDADVGFGTFYNYFPSKDAIAAAVLDCIIEDQGRRNALATQTISPVNFAQVVAMSTRLVLREATNNPAWRWWALRPDLLFDRLHAGLSPFATHDIRAGIEDGLFDVAADEVEQAVSMLVWMMVGGIRNIVSGKLALDSEKQIVFSIMRMLGIDRQEALSLSFTELPPYISPDINWEYVDTAGGLDITPRVHV